MRRLLQAVGLILIVATAAQAQNASLGLKGGLNIANLGGSDIESSDALTSIVGGCFGLIQFTDMVALQPEFMYMQKGSKQDFEGITGKVKLSYFEIPVLLRFTPKVPEGSFVPHFFAGPTIAFKTGCKIEGENGTMTIDIECDDPEFDLPVKSTDIGVAMGGGADVPIGRAFFTIDARYAIGLTTIDDSDPADDVKNKGIVIMAGFRLPLGGAGGLASR